MNTNNKSIEYSLYEYTVRALTDLQFYIAACCIDGNSFDIVIVDEKCSLPRAYTIHSNVCIPLNDTLKMLTMHPTMTVHILEMYIRTFPDSFQGRLQTFLKGYYQLLS